MICEQAQELFSELIDGELDGSTRGAVIAHLERCEGCRRELRPIRRTMRFVRGNSGVDASGDAAGAAWEDFMRSLMDETYPESPESTGLRLLSGDAGRRQGS